MKYDARTLKVILDLSHSEAVKRLFAQDTAQFNRTEIAQIEIELLKVAPPKANLEELFASLGRLLSARNPDHDATRMPRVAFKFPTSPNPFAHGILDAQETYRRAAEWLEENLHAPRKGIASPDSNRSSASLFAMFIVAAILNFEILHADFIQLLLESLQQGRIVRLHRVMIGVSMKLPYGRQEDAETRLVVVRDRGARLVRKLLAHSDFPDLLNGALLQEQAAGRQQSFAQSTRRLPPQK